MKRHQKWIVAIVLLCAFGMNQVFASVLGTEVIYQKQIQMGSGAVLHSNQFYSNQSGVGQQTEYFFEYTPNEDLIPVVANGNQIYGKRNILQASNTMREQGLYPLMGINADYFSFKTGVPMSHTIIDGKVVTKDVSGQDAIGFRKDGTAFISWLEIATVLQTEGQTITIENINKYRQPYGMYLFTDEFGSTTQNTTSGVDVILGNISGEMKLGETITGTVEQVLYSQKEIPIPEGKIVLSMDQNGYQELYQALSTFVEGQTVTITNYAKGDDNDVWKTAYNGLGGIGGRILTNGVVNPNLEKGAAPRSAVGLMPNGNLIFYVIDGRQTGHSYGVQLTTLANRLKELGCIDAINLDGGGSTSIAGVYPGSDLMELINSPSDGAMRQCANFIFLQNTRSPSGELGFIQLYPYHGQYLSGSEVQMSAVGMDTGFYNMEIEDGLQYSIYGGDSEVNNQGIATLKGTGLITITANHGDVEGSVMLESIETPTKIVIKQKGESKELNHLELSIGESVDLQGIAYYGRNLLNSTNECFSWSVEGNIGTINEHGVFTVGNNAGSSGRIEASAGGYAVSIPVEIKALKESQMYPEVYISYENGIIEGTIISTGTSVLAEDVDLFIDGELIYSTDPVNAVRLLTKVQNGERVALSCIVEDGFNQFNHKITVKAKNQFGYSNIGFLSLDGTEELAQPFYDSTNHWANDLISYFYSHGVINGETIDGKLAFRPQDAMTRAEFAVMMSNALGINGEKYDKKSSVFADDKEIPAWAKGQVYAMYEKGIITGKLEQEELRFDSYANITRAEAMTIIGRVLPSNMVKGSLLYADSNDIPEWAKEKMSILEIIGAISGYTDKTIRPNQKVTKAEAVKMLYYIY